MNCRRALIVSAIAISALLWLVRQPNRHDQHSAGAGAASSRQVHTARPFANPPPSFKRTWPRSRALAADPPSHAAYTPPQALQVEWRGNWYPAEILTSSGASNLIRYVGYGAEWHEWVGPERMRYQPAEWPPESTADPVRMEPHPGDFVVRWGNQWWRAEILQTSGDNALIRYVGYGSHWDEWVTPERVKTFTSDDALPTDSAVIQTHSPQELVIHGAPAKGDTLVQWGGEWWPAEIVQVENSAYLVHYTGYGPEWDEWISQERLGIYEGDPP